MKITGVKVSLDDGLATITASLSDGDTLGDVLRIANAIEGTPRTVFVTGKGAASDETVEELRKAMRPAAPPAGRTDEERLVRALETIEELRKENSSEVDRLTFALNERDATCGKLKTSNEELTARLADAGESISDHYSFRRAVCKALVLNEAVPPANVVITIDKLVNELKRLRSSGTTVQLSAYVALENELHAAKAEVDKLRSANRVLVDCSPMREVQRTVQKALDEKEHEAVVFGDDMPPAGKGGLDG